ncbi:MAG TPA: HupE/UreJ family protein [Thermoanaerobaculia bacterium]|nr:HupE/UreJ family protein [Thermoanaerobaculia bacterium]
MGVAHFRALIAAFAVALLAATLSAHEIGTTQVTAHFQRNHTYSIDVVTAPQSLINKVEAAAHQKRSPQLTPAQQQQRLQSFARDLAGSADIRFDDRRMMPQVAVAPIVIPSDPLQPSFVTIRFTGEIPPHARTFSWQWGLTYSAYALALANEGHGDPVRQWIEGDARSTPFALAKEVIPPTRMQTALQYLQLGFTHIVPYGVDHILFVLGLFLLTTKKKQILAQVTAFTIAHSITLALTIYGVVSLPSRIVEPAIALSIAYVAIENMATNKLHPWRIAVVFCFGLLHGMGFAGVLRELGLPRSQFLEALVAFNVGVEAGQLTVIAAATLLIAHWHQEKAWYRGRFVVPASALIALTGLIWTVQRLMA